MDTSGLLKRVEDSWSALLASYAGLSDAEMVEPGVAGTWSVKDIIAHVTSWEEESLKHLPVIAAGDGTPRYSVLYGGIDAFNALTLERAQATSLSEVLRQRDETHRRLLEVIESAPADQIQSETRYRRRLRLDTYGHYPRHMAAIAKWRDRRPGAWASASRDG